MAAQPSSDLYNSGTEWMWTLSYFYSLTFKKEKKNCCHFVHSERRRKTVHVGLTEQNKQAHLVLKCTEYFCLFLSLRQFFDAVWYCSLHPQQDGVGWINLRIKNEMFYGWQSSPSCFVPLIVCCSLGGIKTRVWLTESKWHQGNTDNNQVLWSGCNLFITAVKR